MFGADLGERLKGLEPLFGGVSEQHRLAGGLSLQRDRLQVHAGFAGAERQVAGGHGVAGRGRQLGQALSAGRVLSAVGHELYAVGLGVEDVVFGAVQAHGRTVVFVALQSYALTYTNSLCCLEMAENEEELFLVRFYSTLVLCSSVSVYFV